jgi:hypothetical protein
LTQKYSKKEWNRLRVVWSSHLGKDDWLSLETEHEPISAIPASYWA